MVRFSISYTGIAAVWWWFSRPISAIDPLVIAASQYWEGNDGAWSTFPISVGTPPQTVRVLPASSSQETWVIPPEGCLGRVNDTQTCTSDRGRLFNLTSSTTWENITVQGTNQFEVGIEGRLYGTNVTGFYGFDNLTVGYPGSNTISLDHQIVASVNSEDWFMGVFGLRPTPDNFTGYDDLQPSFMGSLKSQGKIPSSSFGLFTGAKYRLIQKFGSIVLGGYDAALFESNNFTFQFGEDIDFNLLVGIQSIRSTVSTSLLPTSIYALVDSMVSQIWLPEDACDKFQEAFGLEYDSSLNMYFLSGNAHNHLLSVNPNITFVLGQDLSGGQTLELNLPYSAFDLELGWPLVNQTTKYFPLRKASDASQYTLGRAFLQEVYLIVDYERSNFSLHQAVFSPSAPSQIVPILSVDNNKTASNTTGSNTTSIPITSSGGGNGIKTPAIVGIAVSIVVVLAIVILIGIYWYRSKNSPQSEGASKQSRFSIFSRGRSSQADTSVEAKTPVELNADEQRFDAAGPQELQGDVRYYNAELGSPDSPPVEIDSDTSPRFELESPILARAEMDGSPRIQSPIPGMAPVYELSSSSTKKSSDRYVDNSIDSSSQQKSSEITSNSSEQQARSRHELAGDNTFAPDVQDEKKEGSKSTES